MNAEIHLLTGAYALDALSEAERATFETHLDECHSCAAEVAELQATAVRLGVAVAVTPPPSLKADVLAAARRVRQLPPSAPAPASTPVDSPAEPSAPPAGNPPSPFSPRALRRHWPTWTAGLAAAACLVVAVVFGVQAASAERESRQAQQQLDQMLVVLSAPDAKIATASAGDSRVTAVVSYSQGKVAFMARAMPPLPDDRSYQVWSIGPSGMHSVGVMSTGADPAPVLGDLADGERIGVTIEPLGGSVAPSADPVMEFDLPA